MSEFDQWVRDLLDKFQQEFQEGISAHIRRQLQEIVAGMVTPEMLQEMLRGIDLEALAGFLGGRGGRQPGPYEVLGLDETATDEEVRARYRELVKRLHPDVAGPGGEHLFKLVSEAYNRIMKSRGR